MNEYEIKWQETPFCDHQQKVLFVEAESEDDAKILAADHIKRTYGVARFAIRYVDMVTPLPKGKVL